jgi:XTP/dITP diphosphohydrolase
MQAKDIEITKLVAATRNANKLRELRRLLTGLDLEVLSLQNFESLSEVEETGSTFEENARLKALSYTEQTGLPCVADDSGLEVEALGGAPGVYSSRYAGPGADDRALCSKLLGELRDMPDEKRGARFRCAVALGADGRIILTAEGRAQGRIVRQMRGSNGFGYDPVFVPDGHDRTFAEMQPQEKDSISHRSKALSQLRWKLEKLLSRPRRRLS